MEANMGELSACRVWKEGSTNYKAIKMDQEQLLRRRNDIRRFLKKIPGWNNLSNSQIDQTLVYRFRDGYIIQDENYYDFYYPDKRISISEAEFRRERSMIPFEFMGLEGKDFDWGKYSTDISAERDMVNKYILKYPQFRENGMGLYIYSGTKGSGKTMLSCCILNEISKRYPGSVKFINTLDFLEMTKKGFQDGERETDQFYRAGLLIVDDIGVQMSREWTDTVFYRLINERYTNRRPTVYTSNIPIDRLRMDDRIIDRIESTTYLIILPEEPIKRNKRQQEKKILLEKIERGPHGCANTRGAELQPEPYTDTST